MSKDKAVVVETKQEAKEETVQEQMEEMEESGEEIPEDKLPFPRATIVNMLRKNLSKGKQIKGQVKDEMNVWLGKMVERIAKKMDTHPYTYVDGGMLREAIEPYETVQDIEKEKERIIKQLESVKAACDVLINEVDRKFVK
ncbi:MAG: hypothetical protein PHH08_02650 [Candidatus ainarchaeum sp.]|nr:hypothetical protein [Candidatus ainarchaeum sp.]